MRITSKIKAKICKLILYTLYCCIARLSLNKMSTAIV